MGCWFFGTRISGYSTEFKNWLIDSIIPSTIKGFKTWTENMNFPQQLEEQKEPFERRTLDRAKIFRALSHLYLSKLHVPWATDQARFAADIIYVIRHNIKPSQASHSKSLQAFLIFWPGHRQVFTNELWAQLWAWELGILPGFGWAFDGLLPGFGRGLA